MYGNKPFTAGKRDSPQREVMASTASNDSKVINDFVRVVALAVVGRGWVAAARKLCLVSRRLREEPDVSLAIQHTFFLT